MPRSELDRRLLERARGLLPTGALLLIGARSQALNPTTTLDAPNQPAGPHDAALWLAPCDALALRLGLAALRSKLKPGARLVLAVRKRPPVLHQVRGLLGGPAPSPIHLETLCGALLVSGLALPRVHEGPGAFHLLSATLPNDLCALDAFFTQPAAS